MDEKILILDDDYSILKLIERILVSKNYKCDIIDNAKNFIEFSSTNSIFEYDLIISDIFMPGLNGIDFIKKLGAEDYLEKIPVLFITVLQDSDTISKIYEIPDTFAIDYLRKPFEPVELMCRVKTLITLKKKNDELIKYNLEIENTLNKLRMTINERNYLLSQHINTKIEIEKKLEDIIKQIDLVKELVPKIASNDLPVLKFVTNTIENSTEIIDRIVKEGGENEDAFRIITKTVEPMKTACSNIESIITFLIYYGIIDKKSVDETDITRTHFYEVINNLYKLGKISQDTFKSFLENYVFKSEQEQLDIEFF